jgi:hypothetical protein
MLCAGGLHLNPFQASRMKLTQLRLPSLLFSNLYLFPHIFCSFTEGHDSVQDAAVALELALLKASAPREVARVLPWGDDPVPKYSLFEALLTQVCRRFMCAYNT